MYMLSVFEDFQRHFFHWTLLMLEDVVTHIFQSYNSSEVADTSYILSRILVTPTRCITPALVMKEHLKFFIFSGNVCYHCLFLFFGWVFTILSV